MKYKRINENTLAIYISEHDMYDPELDLKQLFTTDQDKVHQVIYDLLKKVDPEGDFFNSGQLSIQMVPRENKGFVINVQKLDLDEDTSEEDMEKMVSQFGSQFFGNMKELIKAADEMAEEEKAEEEEREKKRIAYILGKTQRFEDIVELSRLQVNWHTDEQTIYFKDGYYYVFFRYPQGADRDFVNWDFMAVAEWLEFEARPFQEVLEGAEIVMEDTDEMVMTQIYKNLA